MSKRVVIGLLGVRLDIPTGRNRRDRSRWDSWRPTIDLCRHEDLLVDRLELLYDPRFSKLAGSVAADIAHCSPETTVNLHEVRQKDPWDFAEVYGSLHSFSRSYDFRDDEEYLVHITTGTHVAQICMFLLAETRIIPARLLQTSPPAGGKRGSPGEYRIIDLDLSRYDELAERFESERAAGLSFLKAGIETSNANFNALMERIEEVCLGSRSPILLTGSTGVGKTALARRIYDLKHAEHQVAGTFVEVNCATLRGDQAMSTLFGHVKGAFTGALNARPGLLAEAHGGLLFLDEVGDLGLDEQAMLLRAVEEGCYLPMGADKPSHSEFQLIAGTNRDLYAAVRKGRFREDLLARLDLWSFHLPALHERLEDIPPNLDYELERFEREHGRRVRFNSEARTSFLDFAVGPSAKWCANFRDLNAAVTRLATLAPAGRITREHVREERARLEDQWRRLTQDEEPSSANGLVAQTIGAAATAELDLFDSVQLAEVLRICATSPTLSAAGRTLFAKSRERKASRNDADRLKKYLARFGLTWGDLQ